MNLAATQIQKQKSEEIPTLSGATLPSTLKEVETSPAKIEPVPFEPPVPDNVPQRCVPPKPERKRATQKHASTSEKADSAPATEEKLVVTPQRQVEPEHERIRSGCW